MNILLHVLAAFMLVKLLRSLQLPGAWLAAALFALHPVEVESVAWITELKNSLSMVFFLGSLLLYLRFDLKREWKYRAGSLLLFILAMLSKTSVVPLPVVLLVIAWWKKGRLSWKNDCLPLIPFFLAGLFFSAVTMWVERKYVGTHGYEFEFSLPERFLIVGRGILFYLGKIAWPSPLIFIYPRWTINAAEVLQYAFPFAVLALGVALWLLRARSRAPMAVFLYFVFMLVPVVGFISQWAFRYSFVADHWVNLASLGPIVFVSALAAAAWAKATKGMRLSLSAGCGVILVLLAVLTWRQCRMYADSPTLYHTILEKNPACWMACNNLGTIMLDNGRTDEALAWFDKSLDINPDNAESITNLGNALTQLGRTDEAIARYQDAVTLDPRDFDALNGLGVVSMKAGKTEESIAWYRKALELNDEDELVHYNLGNALLRSGKPGEAINEYRRALEINPLHTQAYNNLGGAFMQLHRPDLAVRAYLKAIRAEPASMDLLNNLCQAFLQSGNLPGGMKAAGKALELALQSGDTALAREIQGNLIEMKEAYMKSQGAGK
jgi:Flp pilus assembly protein TadD